MRVSESYRHRLHEFFNVATPTSETPKPKDVKMTKPSYLFVALRIKKNTALSARESVPSV
jgi:hypothetical protein